MSAMSATDLAAGRLRLAELLAEAAELEHSLLCQYLYAAFSLKRSTTEGPNWAQLEMMRGWRTSILLVARQEMEHLGYVCNLLTAIGEPPHLSRPDFPLGPRHYPMAVPCRLERFGPEALKRFILFEIPQQLDAVEQKDLERALPRVVIAEHQTIGALYEEIRALFGTLAGPGLFVGPPSAQTANVQIRGLRGVQVGSSAPIYDVLVKPVSDLASAQAAVDQIVLEGEGAPGNDENSHFARFCEIAGELAAAQAADPTFDPARPLVSDPDRRGVVSVPATLAVCELFDLAYETMMLLLIRFFAHADETEGELAGIQQVVFFPMMTTVVRPLGEVLTLLPAKEHSTERAGPAFSFTRAIAQLPHRHSAWTVIGGQLELLGNRAGELAIDAAYPLEAQTRLGLMAENLQRMAKDFLATMEPQA
jgi:hypothetical protein